jgi:hypothetical protein
MVTRDQYVAASVQGYYGRCPCTLLRQQLQRLENRGVKKISADVVEAEIVGSNIGLAGCPQIVLFM